jgi:hypothetical protein
MLSRAAACHNRGMRRIGLILLAASALSGCAKTQAKTPAPPVALETPAPPDRVIIPAPMPEPVERATQPAAPAPAPAPRQRETPPTRPAERTPPANPPAPQPPAVAEPAPSPPPVLQTTANPGEVEQQARMLLAAAERDLDSINPARLNANGRTQYTTARNFVRQAETALKEKNVVLARDMADKAAVLANQLRR